MRPVLVQLTFERGTAEGTGVTVFEVRAGIGGGIPARAGIGGGTAERSGTGRGGSCLCGRGGGTTGGVEKSSFSVESKRGGGGGGPNGIGELCSPS
jgi:hypothetical protein